ncbi:P2Y purinoceptor 4-like [Lethenteron reissneri]|uniref:P2Y purinoceptor 4-like n=1 Tax=Lethenteron reissneri TaxID=7753 RepID=UPI002AB7A83C|nr:P2Y purinoceptor 4-like [Lethenteron reissneri]
MAHHDFCNIIKSSDITGNAMDRANPSRFQDSLVECCSLKKVMETYVLPTLYGIVFVVGISLNCTALLAYRGRPRPWSCNTIILFNLTLSDLLYLLNLPICMYNYIDQSPMTWPQVIFRCKFTTFAFYQNLYLSITILMWMSVYRCVGVVSPVRARQILRRRVVILSCVFMWLAVTLGLFKVATLEQTTDSNGTALCHDLVRSLYENKEFAYSWCLVVFGFLMPYSVIVLCQCVIVRTIRRSRGTMQPARSRSARLIAATIIMFTISFLPHHIMRVIRLETLSYSPLKCHIREIVNAIYTVSKPMAGLHMCVNPILYVFSGKVYFTFKRNRIIRLRFIRTVS